MLDVLNYQAGEMPPTATYSSRRWCFVPVKLGAERFDNRVGNVSIRLQKARGVRRVVEQDTYAVEYDPNPEPGEVGLAFWFTNLDPEHETPYRVVVAPGGKAGRCTCKAGQCKAPSDKHVDALVAMIADGALDDYVPADVLARAAVPPAELRPVAAADPEPEPYVTDWQKFRNEIVVPF